MSKNTPVASYSLTVRVRIANKPGMLGQGDLRHRRGRRRHRRGRHRRGRAGRRHARHHVQGPRRGARPGRSSSACGGAGRQVVNVSDRTFLMHLGGKIEIDCKMPVKTRDDLSMAYTPGVARVCMAIHDDPREGLHADDQAEHGGGRHRRHRGARPRRHRPGGGAAGHGRQGAALQGVRRRRRLADLPRHQGRRRDRAHRQGDRAGLRRHQPGGHLGARAASRSRSGSGGARHPGLPRRPARHRRGRPGRADQRAKIVKKRLNDVRIVFTGAGAAGDRLREDLMLAGARHIIAATARAPSTAAARRT